MYKYLLFNVVFFLFINFISAQEVRVIDNKGTITKIRNNQVTTSNTSPSSPLEGDVWFDTNTNVSKIYDGTQWLVIDLDNVTKDTTAPTTPVIGDVWFDTSSTPNVSKIWDGTTWLTISSGGSGDAWDLIGNSGTDPSTNFVGTTDNKDLVLKSNNIEKLKLFGTKKQVLVNQAITYKEHPFIIRANDNDLLAFQNSTGTTKWHWNLLGGGLNFVETDVEDYRFFLKEGGNVGIGINNPTRKLDINGDLRIRDIGLVTNTDLDVLVADATGVVKKKTILPNKSYVYTHTASQDFNSGNAKLLKRFPVVTIQPNKKVRLDLYVPARNMTNNNNWGGLYVNVNVRINGGTWYNLGNTGYDGGVMHYSARSIHALNHEMLLDFVGELGLSTTAPYTVEFELYARSYNGTTRVNGSHDINRPWNNLNTRGTPVTWARGQNYTHIIITEMDR